MANVVTRWMVFLLSAFALALAPGDDARAQQAKTPAKKAQSQAKKAPAKQTQPAPQPKQAALVIDANTGRVLHDESGDVPRFPASLTKMMTLYLVFGEIEQGRLTFATPMSVSTKAASAPPSKLDLKPGDSIQVIDAVKALVVKSANDVSLVIAEHIGGSEAGFVRLMNERARQLGMRSSTFRNPSGLPDPQQLTTARDMITLALRLQDDFPKHYQLFSTTAFSYRGKTYKSHNTLMTTFPGMDGIKTGYTRASGFNLVSSVKTDNKHVIGAVFGGKTAAARNQHMQVLLYQALEKASTRKSRQPSQLIAWQRPAAEPRVAAAAAAPELPWSTETRTPPPPPPKIAKAPPPSQKAPPPPAAVARKAQPDAISQVLAQGDAPGSHSGGAQALAAAPPQPPRLDLEALRAAMSEGGDEETVAELPDPEAAPQDIAGLIRNSIVDGTPPTGFATAGAHAGPGVARQPSSLQSQAALLGAAAPAGGAAAPLRHTEPAPAGRSGYEIQIGAFSSAQEAQSKLEVVRGRAGHLLEGHSGVTLPVQKANRQIFRARFVNFDEGVASNTCLELRRLAIDCFVLPAD